MEFKDRIKRNCSLEEKEELYLVITIIRKQTIKEAGYIQFHEFKKALMEEV